MFVSNTQRLAYPGGALRPPGVNKSHPASKNLLFSIISAPSSIQLLRTDLCTIGTIAGVGSSFVMDGIIGPCYSPAISNNGGTARGSFSINTTSGNATIACIIRPTSITGGSTSRIITSGNSAAISLVNSTGVVRVNFAGSSTDTAHALAANVPYFVCCIIISGSKIFSVVTNLNTGSINSFTTATANTVATGTGIVVGNNSTTFLQGFGGYIAAVAWSRAILPPAQLLQWAQDPWSFWYPKTLVYDKFRISAAAQSVVPLYMHRTQQWAG